MKLLISAVMLATGLIAQAKANNLNLDGFYLVTQVRLTDEAGITKTENAVSSEYIHYFKGTVTSYSLSDDGKSVEIDSDKYTVNGNVVSITQDKTNPCYKEDSPGAIDGSHPKAKITSAGLELLVEDKNVSKVSANLVLKKIDPFLPWSFASKIQNLQKTCIEDGKATKVLN